MHVVLRFLRACATALVVFAILGGVWFLFWVDALRLFTAGGSLALPAIYGFEANDTELLFFWTGIFASALVSLAAFILLFVGLSARRLANRMIHEVLESREMFLKLYDRSPIPYLLISHKGEVQFPNKAAVRFFNAEGWQFEGTDFFSFLAEDETDGLDSLDPAQNRYRRGEAVEEEEMEIRLKNGVRRFALLSIFILEHPREKHTGLVTLVDITKRKEIEKAKTEFVSLASHQMGTPLSAMRWYTELLASPKAGTLTLKQKTYLERIRGGNARLIELINTFLDASRLELGTFAPEKKDVVISEFVDGVIGDFEKTIAEKGIHIDTKYAAARGAYRSDPRLLRMIVQNLVSNALKYTSEGGSVNIYVHERGAELVIAVKDTGFGIPEDEQDKIFTKLFRARNAREQVSQGNGLGLYVVRLAAEALNGSVSFVSKENEGTEFTVVLPL